MGWDRVRCGGVRWEGRERGQKIEVVRVCEIGWVGGCCYMARKHDREVA